MSDAGNAAQDSFAGYFQEILRALMKDPPEIPDDELLGPLAHVFWNAGRIQESLSCIRLLEMRAGLDAGKLLMKGFWKLYLGESANARRAFEAALEKEPANFGARLGHAFALFYLEDYAGAAKGFQSLVKDGAPFRSPAVMADSSVALMAGGKPGEIQMAPVPDLPPGMSEVLQMKLLHGEAGAIRQAQTLLKTSPAAKRLPLLRLVVELYLDDGHGRNEEARKLIDESLETWPDDGPLLIYRGIVMRRLGNRDESHEAFRHAVAFAPLEPRGWGGFAAGWMERNEPENAVKAFRTALFLDGTNPHFWGDLGQAEFMLERYESARTAFTKAIELGAKTFTNYFNRGQCAEILGDRTSALKDWARAIEINPNHHRVAEIRRSMETPGKEPDNRFVFGDVPEG